LSGMKFCPSHEAGTGRSGHSLRISSTVAGSIEERTNPEAIPFLRQRTRRINASLCHISACVLVL
jgi:hypothetical protein